MGVSGCLLGDASPPIEGLGRYVEWVPVCLEREAARLARGEKRARWIDPLHAWAVERARALDVHGAILREETPVCCLGRVGLHPARGGTARDPFGSNGAGLLAAAFTATHPLVPVEEERRLRDRERRVHFLERVFAWARLRALLDAPFTPARLQAFHAAHKYQLLAHSPAGYRELGRLVAARSLPPAEQLARYATTFMEMLSRPATRGRQANVLQHILGHFRGALDAADREEALEQIDAYRRGIVPLAVPLTLLRHFARKHGDGWLRRQTYLAPMPLELLYG